MDIEEYKEHIRLGRPPKYDREEYAIKLIEWVQKDDSINLCGFCADEHIPDKYLSRWEQDNEIFREVFNIVKYKLAKKREQLANEGKLTNTTFAINAKTYDKILYNQWKDEKEFEMRLKKEIEKEDVSKVDGRLLELLDSLRNQKGSEDP